MLKMKCTGHLSYTIYLFLLKQFAVWMTVCLCNPAYGLTHINKLILIELHCPLQENQPTFSFLVGY